MNQQGLFISLNLKNQNMKIDNVDFNEKHYAGWKEEDFVKDQLASVPDSYGSESNKVTFLKKAFAKINEVSKPAKADEKVKA